MLTNVTVKVAASFNQAIAAMLTAETPAHKLIQNKRLWKTKVLFGDKPSYVAFI